MHYHTILIPLYIVLESINAQTGSDYFVQALSCGSSVSRTLAAADSIDLYSFYLDLPSNYQVTFSTCTTLLDGELSFFSDYGNDAATTDPDTWVWMDNGQCEGESTTDNHQEKFTFLAADYEIETTLGIAIRPWTGLGAGGDYTLDVTCGVVTPEPTTSTTTAYPSEPTIEPTPPPSVFKLQVECDQTYDGLFNGVGPIDIYSFYVGTGGEFDQVTFSTCNSGFDMKIILLSSINDAEGSDATYWNWQDNDNCPSPASNEESQTFPVDEHLDQTVGFGIKPYDSSTYFENQQYVLNVVCSSATTTTSYPTTPYPTWPTYEPTTPYPTLPTTQPTLNPSDAPTTPTTEPTNAPTTPPTNPTESPTDTPSMPTTSPTDDPTMLPTEEDMNTGDAAPVIWTLFRCILSLVFIQFFG